MITYLNFFDYEEAFDYYCELIDKMTRGVNRNNHARIIAKPALILSIIKMIEEGKTVNKFTYKELEKDHPICLHRSRTLDPAFSP